MTEKKPAQKQLKRSAEETTQIEVSPVKKTKFTKPDQSTRKPGKDAKNTPNKGKPFVSEDGKPVDWNEFKKQKKELRLKRKETRCVDDIRDVLPKVKQLDEKIRVKTLRGGKEARDELINEIHSILNKRNVYSKLVLAHDTTRIVQHILKYGSASVREEVSKQIIPVTIEMIQSKYGKFCVKRMLKYGTPDIRAQIIKKFYGHVTKLTSHAVSAPIFEYAYSTFATAPQKHHLIQEFFGDIYKSSKDDNIKHLRDVYAQTPVMKVAALGATKANLLRVLNKNFLDSGLVQSVLYQFLSECSKEEKAEFVSQLAEHIVVISNSKDGARVAMQCIWNGSTKERKIMMKALKEHVVELAKHEHGHCTVITLMDVVDDTVLLGKIILSELLKHATELAVDEWGRKVVFWMVAPGDKAHFHPTFLKELEDGKQHTTSKKPVETRQKEVLDACSPALLKLIAEDAKTWLANGSVAMVALAVLKTGSDSELKEALLKVSEVLVDANWKLKNGEEEIAGIEHSGLHMMLKKLAQNDAAALKSSKTTFGECLSSTIDDETMKRWLVLNRGCFLLVAILENSGESTQEILKNKIAGHKSLLKKQTFSGAKVLLKKIK